MNHFRFFQQVNPFGALLILCLSLGCLSGFACTSKKEVSSKQSASIASSVRKGVAIKKKKQASSGAPLVNASFPAASRLVAIGDLHGDFNATVRAFALAGAIQLPKGQEVPHWVGAELVVVQTGDQLDRGDGELKILQFLKRMKQEAKAAGGALHVLNGNHETMNAMGDFRYVTPAGFRVFTGTTSDSPLVQRFKTSVQGRAAAFLPGGPWAVELAKQPLIIQVGAVLFAHGGILPAHLAYGVARLNQETSAWLLSKKSKPPALVVSPDGPLWTRLYGSPVVDAKACATLSKVLEKTSAQLMVVGHTVQPGGVNFACSRKLARIDVGLSAHYSAPQVSILEIEQGRMKVIEGPLPR